MYEGLRTDLEVFRKHNFILEELVLIKVFCRRTGIIILIFIENVGLLLASLLEYLLEAFLLWLEVSRGNHDDSGVLVDFGEFRVIGLIGTAIISHFDCN